MALRNIFVVSIGGIIGSLLRWLISLAFSETGFPWGTLLVNYTGSIILMVALLYINGHKSPQWWWRPAIAAGFCGGYTTYSAFALKLDQYFAHGNVASAIGYTAASLIGTYILVFVTHETLKNRWVK